MIKTDCKPLVPLLDNIELDKNPACIQRFRIHLMRFHYRVEHISGKNSVIVDALSLFLGSISEDDVVLMKEVELFAVSAIYRTVSSPRL